MPKLFRHGSGYVPQVIDDGFFPDDEQSCARFGETLAKMCSLHGFCKIMLGDFEEAGRLILKYSKRQTTTSIFHLGLATLGLGEEASAAALFVIVLVRKKGHEGADGELKEMEGRLEKLSTNQKAKVEHYLKIRREGLFDGIKPSLPEYLVMLYPNSVHED